MSIRVLLVEDHHLFRIGLKYVLDQTDGIEVVGDAGDLKSGLKAIRETEPDVAVLDLDLPDAKGLELFDAIKAEASDVAVLVVSAHDGDDWADRVLQAGGRGFVNKAAQFPEVVAAIKAVHAGRRFVSVSQQGQTFRHDPAPEPKATVSEQLSKREREVLSHVARGLTNQQTADLLFLSVKTVETYRSRLMRKLGLSGRSQLFEYARDTGLLVS